ncbi:MAG: substrate-binding domain-containing protein [Bacilli bacterium]
MKKSLVLLSCLSAVAILASCGGGTAWSWNEAKSDGVLNYGLLIGQIDHNDSAARTAGIRDALKTRGTVLTNANTETPVEGSIAISGTNYKVVEVEHAEQRATGGATWDQATATSTAETWNNKYGNKLDFIVSNNDGMAEGAIGASNWRTGTPIFGYDSNASTLNYIKEGKIMGTINQNASAQAAGIMMLTRNCIDKVAAPTASGFSAASDNGYGKISSAFTYKDTDGSMLVDNFKITAENVDGYLGKTSADLIDTAVTKGTTASSKVWLSYYSSTDTFLNSTMKPLFEGYKDKFNFDVTATFGNANDEATSISNLETALNTKTYKAYVINMVKTTSTASYLDKIATTYSATSENPTDVPVIFWNRQGTNSDGTVDTATMKDSRFKYIYYVGFDAIQGGKLQGEMIVDYLQNLK